MLRTRWREERLHQLRPQKANGWEIAPLGTRWSLYARCRTVVSIEIGELTQKGARLEIVRACLWIGTIAVEADKCYCPISLVPRDSRE
jgi:hypothetical protein